MRRVRPVIFVLFLLLSACRFALPLGTDTLAPQGTPVVSSNPGQTQAIPYQPAHSTLIPPTATPTLFIPLRPSPAAPTPVFPNCQPDPVEPYRYDPSRLPPEALLSTAVPTAPTLRSLAQRHGVLIGAATAPSMFRNAGYSALLAGQFSMLAAENAMKWEVIRPQPDVYDFSQGDALVDFAIAHDMKVYAHVLVWNLQQPAWLTEGQHTRDEWIQILCRHIKTVVGHYRGQIFAWDVVNEPFTRNGELTVTHWMHVIGPEYIAMAFQWAREADPGALLVLNEFNAEGMNEKSQGVYTLVKSLLRQGTPIDAVGLQMHIRIYGPPTPDDTQPKEWAAQAETYRNALTVCLEIPTCTVFAAWGVSDNVSWIPDYTNKPDAPLLFDAQYQPKPAYDALIEVLSKGP